MSLTSGIHSHVSVNISNNELLVIGGLDSDLCPHSTSMRLYKTSDNNQWKIEEFTFTPPLPPRYDSEAIYTIIHSQRIIHVHVLYLFCKNYYHFYTGRYSMTAHTINNDQLLLLGGVQLTTYDNYSMVPAPIIIINIMKRTWRNVNIEVHVNIEVYVYIEVHVNIDVHIYISVCSVASLSYFNLITSVLIVHFFKVCKPN